jgi:adenine specific DNA methylase Mod
MIDQKQPENVVYFKYLDSMITNYAICICEIKLRVTMPKAAFKNLKKNALFISKLVLSLRKKLVKYYIWSIAVYGAEIWTLRKVHQK